MSRRGYGGYRGHREGGRDDESGDYRRDRSESGSYSRGGGRSRGGRGRSEGFDRGRGRGDGGYQSRGPVDRLVDENMFERLNESSATSGHVGDMAEVTGSGELHGAYGQSLELSCNYFRVCSVPKHAIYQYHVSFEPDIESRRLKTALLKSQSDIVRCVSVFDGSMLFIPDRIENMSKKVTSNQGNEFEMSVKFVAVVNPGSASSVFLFNIIMRKVMKMVNLKQIKRKHFNPNEAKIIESCGLEVWPGVTGTFSFFNNQPLYCVDVSHHVMRRESAYDFIFRELKSINRASKEEIEKRMVGQIVMTRYNNRSYRIDSIDWINNPQSTFDLRSGEKISYVDYYKKQYNINIEDIKQPLLVSRLKERRVKHEIKQAKSKGEEVEPLELIVHLIPELSYLTGISDELRSNFTTMRELSKFTRLEPTSRCNGVYGFLNTVRGCNEASDYMRSWGLEFSNQLATIPGRQFPPEKILFSASDQPFQTQAKDCDWTQALRSIKLQKTCSLDKWFLVYPHRDQNTVESFLKTLNEAANGIGFKISYPEMVGSESVNVGEISRRLREIRDDKSYQMGMFAIPPNRKEIYDVIKSICCVEQPLPTQVVLLKTLQRQNALRSVATKVAIQMSVKLGGEPWSVVIPSKQKMIVGIDVCHDAGSGRNSWLGFVASLNNSFTRYFSTASRQPSRTEISDTLHANFRKCLSQYYEMNRSLPNGILVYRDGVGDGQVESVKSHELPSVQSCLCAVYEELGVHEPPSLAYIIVRKRINTKLFSASGSFANNPLPGSIVDRVICKNEYPNFYLISQSVREGTVNPTHYLIIYNNTTYKTDIIQRLSYKICHLYFNWCGTVRVPAPCQYAHKLCFLVSQSIKKEPNNQLSSLLYYL